MKKVSNIIELKNMVNSSVLEALELNRYGIQAYGISANEYEVITKFVKKGGRYYFVDRDGNKYLASRYDRYEFAAGEFIAAVNDQEKDVNEFVVSTINGEDVAVNFEYVVDYLNKCDKVGLNVQVVKKFENEVNETFWVYRKVENKKLDRILNNHSSAKIAAAVAIIAAVNPEGFTVDAATLQPIKAGYAIALKRTQNSFGAEGLAKVAGVIKELQKDKTARAGRSLAFGGWYDSESKQYFYDATVIVNDRVEALELGRANEQIAIFDLNDLKEIRL